MKKITSTIVVTIDKNMINFLRKQIYSATNVNTK